MPALLDALSDVDPSMLAIAERFGRGDETSLLQAERDAVAHASAGRRAEYAAVRSCARAAMEHIGATPASILNRDDRSPVWPPGLVGSLTHTTGYCAAAVAHSDAVASVGIDAEPDEALKPQLADRILTARELDHVSTLPADGPHWSRLVFAVKEAMYKVWHPLMGRWLGFVDVNVTIDPSGGFDVELLDQVLHANGADVQSVSGRWLQRGDFLLATAVVPRRR